MALYAWQQRCLGWSEWTWVRPLGCVAALGWAGQVNPAAWSLAREDCNIIVQNIIFPLITETSNSSLQLTEPTMECNQPSAATLGSAFLGMMGHKFLNGHNYTSVAITDHEWSSSAHCTDMQAMCDHVKQWRAQYLDKTPLEPYPCRCFYNSWIDWHLILYGYFILYVSHF